jgi:hypothetical protein
MFLFRNSHAHHSTIRVNVATIRGPESTDPEPLKNPMMHPSHSRTAADNQPLSSSQAPWYALVAHSAAHSNTVQRIDVRAYQTKRGTLRFEYVLLAPMSQIRVPPARQPVRGDELWEHTCFEAFIATPTAPGYYELNFSPSREWAIYRFDAYRHGRVCVEVVTSPDLVVRRFDDRLELDATIVLSELAAPQKPEALKLALTAVVEAEGGRLSYWALKHAPDKPDFHHADGFVLELPG